MKTPIIYSVPIYILYQISFPSSERKNYAKSYNNIRPITLYFVEPTHVSEFRVPVSEGLLHAYVADIAPMVVKHRTDLNDAVLEDEAFHRIVREVDVQVLGVRALEFVVVVFVLIPDDLLSKRAPGREIHPCRMRNLQL